MVAKSKNRGLLVLVLLLGVLAIHPVDAVMEARRNGITRRILSSKQERKKVRGWSTNKENSHARRLKSSDSSDEEGKGGKGGSKTSSSDDSSTKKSSKKSKTKGSKTAKSKSQSMLPSKSYSASRSSQSMKSSNIFEHSDDFNDEMVEREVVQVECGSDESPFLTTFVASIQLQQPDIPMTNRLKESRKKSSSKKSRIEVYDSDEDSSDSSSEEDEDESEFPTNDLSPAEQRVLESTFREAYNNWTFFNCDGFFRTVFTVTLTLVEKDEQDDEYSVTLENTYRTDGRPGGFELMVQNGTTDIIDMERTGAFGDNRWLKNSTNGTVFNTPQRISGEGEDPTDPTTYVQTIAGNADTPIYYVSLAATCRNCDVTDQVNFPLLEISDEDYLEVEVSRQGQPIPVATTTAAMGDDGENTEEAVCTCSLPVEGEDAETSRRRRHRRHLQQQQRRLAGHNLYIPPPNGPTPEEFIRVMNAAITRVQENEGQLLRVAGLVDLIEPDYFQGENPEYIFPPTASPTVSAMPSVSSAPSLSPTNSAAPSTSSAPTGDPTDFPLNTTSSMPSTSPPTTRPPTPRPTKRPSTPAPVAAAEEESSASPTKWLLAILLSSLSGLVLPLLVL